VETTPSDQELVQRIREGPADDVRAFETLVRRYERRVLTNCRFLSGSPTDAPDLAQEVFVKAYFGLERFEGRSSLRTWLERIKANHCINWVKKKRPSFLDVDAPMTQAELKVEPEAEAELDAQDERERIQRVLNQLSDSLRIPLLLRDMDGFSYDDIASNLGLGLSAVKMRIKRGREEFRRLYELADEGPSEGAGA